MGVADDVRDAVAGGRGLGVAGIGRLFVPPVGIGAGLQFEGIAFDREVVEAVVARGAAAGLLECDAQREERVVIDRRDRAEIEHPQDRRGVIDRDGREGRENAAIDRVGDVLLAGTLAGAAGLELDHDAFMSGGRQGEIERRAEGIVDAEMIARRVAVAGIHRGESLIVVGDDRRAPVENRCEISSADGLGDVQKVGVVEVPVVEQLAGRRRGGGEFGGRRPVAPAAAAVLVADADAIGFSRGGDPVGNGDGAGSAREFLGPERIDLIEGRGAGDVAGDPGTGDFREPPLGLRVGAGALRIRKGRRAEGQVADRKGGIAGGRGDRCLRDIRVERIG